MKYLKKIIPVILALALLLCCAGCGDDDDRSLSDVIERKTLTIGVDTTIPPVAFTDENGNYTGIAPDIAAEFASRLDTKLVVRTVYTNEAVDALNSGKIDCFIGYPEVDYQTELLISSLGMKLDRNIAVIVPTKSKAKRLYDLKGTTVGAVLRTDALATLTNASELRASLKDVKTYPEASEVLEALDSKDIQAAVFEETYLLYLSQIVPDKYRILDQKLSSGEYYMLFKKDADSLRRRVEQLYDLLDSTGRLNEIFDEWTGAKIPEEPEDEPLLTQSESDLIYGTETASSPSDVSGSDNN